MPRIPSSINGVEIRFKPNVVPIVGEPLIAALRHVIRPYVYGRLKSTGKFGVSESASAVEASGRFTMTSLTVSSARDAAHSPTSRHYFGLAVDISRMNGLFFADQYPKNAGLRAIVRRMQRRFEAYTPTRRENFGPYQCLKMGVARPDQAEAHKNHIHFSVNG
jgi:hypothetical protein